MIFFQMALILAVFHRAIRIQREPARVLARSRCNSR
jgi:hypothetical protein